MSKKHITSFQRHASDQMAVELDWNAGTVAGCGIGGACEYREGEG